MKNIVLLFLYALLAQTFSQKLVLLGSNLRDDNDVIWKRIVNLAGGIGAAQIGVVSVSTAKTAESGKVIDNLIRAGAKSAVAIPVTKTGASDPAKATLIKNQTGIFIVEDSDLIAPPPTVPTTASSCISCINEFFFPAGVPSSSSPPPSGVVCYEGPTFKRQNLIDTLRPAGVDSFVLAAIRSVITKGGLVAGNAAIMSKSTVIMEGDSVSSLVIGSREFYSFPRKPLAVNKKGGLNLLNLTMIIESGLSENGREVRLMRALIDSGIPRGIGVDENTALVVTNPFTRPVGEVVVDVGSTSGVMDVDVSSVPRSSISDGVYENVQFSVATVNDTIDLVTGNLTYAPWKVAIAGEEWFPTALPSDDILSLSNEGQWRFTARYLIDCKDLNVTSYSPASLMPLRPRIQVYMDRKLAVGYGADMPDDPDFSYVASYRQMLATVKVLGISL